MSTVGEWNESLDNIDDLISCMGSLEREDIIYLDEYLVGETSPQSQSPSHWLALMKGDSEEENCQEDEEEIPSVPENMELGNLDNPDDVKLIIDLAGEKQANQPKHSGLGKKNLKQSRTTRGVAKPKFVSYESFPANKAKLFLCELCGMKLSTREARRRHILSKHIKERKNFCKTCGKSFIFQFALKAHKAVHSEIPRYICVCGMSYTIRASYMDHIKRIHRAASEIKYPCELCFKSFGDRQTLRIHLISVHKPKTISCIHKGCPKVFSTIGLMRNHYRYHLNRKFTCDECGRSFSTKSYMYKHRRSHSGIREHVCLDCGKTYLSASHLTKHRRMAHSSVRPFQCSFCGKCYKTKDQVNYHESSHKGEKPFQCEVCGYATSYRNTYYAHRKKHFVKNTPEGSSTSETQHNTSDTLKSDKSVVKPQENEDSCDKGKKSSASSKPRGKPKDTNKGKNASVHKKGEIKSKSCANTGNVETNNDDNSEVSMKVPQLQPFGSKDVDDTKRLSTQMPTKESMDVIYVISSRSNTVTKPEQQVTSLLPSNNSQNSTFKFILEESKLESESCSLLGCNESSVINKSFQEKSECCNVNIQSDDSLALQAAGRKPLDEKSEVVLPSDKQNSCIILSSSGRCAVPTCDSGDDSLLLIKVGDNSYVGVCRHHTFSDQLNESQKNIQANGESISGDASFQEFNNISIQITAEPQKEENELITLVSPDATFKTSEEVGNTSDPEGGLGNQSISLISLPEKYDKVEVDTAESISQVPELEAELLKAESISHTSHTDTNDMKLSSNGVCPVEEFSAMIELDSGVASLSGNIVDDPLSLAQLEVICPLCDEQFLCMDAYVTHLECSHN